MKYKQLTLDYKKEKEYYIRVIDLIYWLDEIKLTNIQLEILSAAILSKRKE